MAVSDPHEVERVANDLTSSGGSEEKLRSSFIGSIDQGTTSTRFLIFNGLGVPVASHQIEFKQIYPHSGWVRHLRELPRNVRKALTALQMDRT